MYLFDNFSFFVLFFFYKLLPRITEICIETMLFNVFTTSRSGTNTTQFVRTDLYIRGCLFYSRSICYLICVLVLFLIQIRWENKAESGAKLMYTVARELIEEYYRNNHGHAKLEIVCVWVCFSSQIIHVYGFVDWLTRIINRNAHHIWRQTEKHTHKSWLKTR